MAELKHEKERCVECNQPVEFGDVALPKVKDFIKLTCGSCGETTHVSLLRMYLRRNEEERPVNN